MRQRDHLSFAWFYGIIGYMEAGQAGNDLQSINETLDNINQTLKKISSKMPEPDHPFIRGLVIAGIAVSVFGILQAADIIMNWFGG